jgi:hypothetical protein
MRAILASALLLVAVPALAQRPPPPPASKIELAARLGFGLPFGKLSSTGDKISNHVTGVIPIAIEGNYRFTANFLAGVYLSYAILLAKDCPSGQSCGGHVLHFGIQGSYHLTPGGSFDPWVGLGVGYESLTLTVTELGRSASADGTGWQFANFQVGGDLRVSPTFYLGPFVSFSVDETTSIGFAGFSSSDFDKTLHEWLMFGVRGRVDI